MEGKIIGNFQILKVLGEGGFSIVYLAEVIPEVSNAIQNQAQKQLSKKFVALKLITNQAIPFDTPNRHQIIKNLIQKEIENSKEVKSKNIVKIIGKIEDYEDRIWTITEYVAGGTLTQFVASKEDTKLSEVQAQHLTWDLCNGLKCIADCNIIHRDIKPDNLLLTNNSELPNLKIADFGLSTKNAASVKEKCGTKYYAAPEMKSGFFDQSLKVDV